MKNYADSIEYQKYVGKFDYIFDKEYFIDTKKIDLVKNLAILVENYNHTYKTSKNYGYDISCQMIYLLKDGNKIYQQKMVWGRPFFQYVKHSNGNEYFICGNDLLDFSIYNITKNRENRFVSEVIINEETKEPCNNEFWYIKNWIYNPTNNLVAINGQDGMNCCTVTLCDFSNPDKLPFKFKNLIAFAVKEYGDSTCVALGWSKDNSLELTVREEDSKEIVLTESEIYELLNDNDGKT